MIVKNEGYARHTRFEKRKKKGRTEVTIDDVSVRAFVDLLDGEGFEGERPGDNRALFNLGSGARWKRRGSYVS